MKELKKINKVQDILAKGALQKWYQEGNQLKKLFGQLEQAEQGLKTAMSSEQLEEFPGQPKQEQEMFAPEQGMEGQGGQVPEQGMEGMSQGGMTG